MPLPLEDIILPPPPGSWPWAAGIWACLLLGGLIGVWILRILLRKWPFWRARRRLIHRLTHQTLTPAQLNRLLHSFACVWLHAPATACGTDWVSWMQRQAPGLPAPVSHSLERLAEAPYTDAPDDPALTRAAILWLRQVRP